MLFYIWDKSFETRNLKTPYLVYFERQKCIFYLLDVLILNLIPFLFYNAMLQGKNSVLEQEQINTATLQSQFRKVKKDMYVK